ncbi:ABC transporter ATP-binding protein [Actinacidiphila sp. ITFR-21]|uniref:ABC transporter ATP-binding protein n=1 Tax=Actinacidiphila sp. ITFR-21 TaxID=3075199 RepID=UPI00288A478D|nr:ABC transporter ATP-binding protein [Streptomyces sp. ITFR-21]WNI19005.1 ABC transporter ATP-binding protein [Streptomyces sp. ITFR-21]
MASEPLLDVDGLDAHYGKTQALFGVSLQVRPGERVALLGRNGAGKTTTLLSVMGVAVRRSGRVRVDGRDVVRMRTPEISRLGIAWVPDTRRVFKSMSVRENIQVAARGNPAQVLDQVVAEFPLLEPLLARDAGNLSGGEQQVLAIGRALATRPRVLLLDEPTEGLAPVVTEQLRESLVRLGGGDMAIVLAEQSVSFALGFCSRVYIFEVGRVVYGGTSREVTENREQWQRYIVEGGAIPAAGRPAQNDNDRNEVPR